MDSFSLHNVLMYKRIHTTVKLSNFPLRLICCKYNLKYDRFIETFVGASTVSKHCFHIVGSYNVRISLSSKGTCVFGLKASALFCVLCLSFVSRHLETFGREKVAGRQIHSIMVGGVRAKVRARPYW